MKIFIYGAGGHAKVAIDILESFYEIVCVIDDNHILEGTLIMDVPIKSFEFIDELKNQGITKCFVAVGDNKNREKIVDKLSDFTFINAIHTSSCVSSHATIGNGVLVNAGAIVNAGSVIKDHSIINTSATIDHDCIIEEFSHICPGVNLAGGVIVGRHTLVGIGSTVIQNISIGENTTIGASSVVVNNIESNKVAYGHPCKVKA